MLWRAREKSRPKPTACRQIIIIIIIDFSSSPKLLYTLYSVGVGTSELFVTAYVTRGKNDNNIIQRGTDPFWECGDFNNYLYIRQFTKISTARVNGTRGRGAVYVCVFFFHTYLFRRVDIIIIIYTVVNARIVYEWRCFPMKVDKTHSTRVDRSGRGENC